jgi:glycosyltransferase involved in cell wall biosynthesis
LKRVLIITYYWPPSGGAGVQRWLKFAKYLPEFGWQPIIYTPSNPESPAVDESLLKDIHPDTIVLKQPIWEPYHWYRQFLGQKDKKIGSGFVSEKKDSGLMQRVSVWIRGNLFIPDARRFWIDPSVKYLTEYLEKNPVDAVVTTGPPHSMHLIGLGLKQRLPIKWIADFRDPWTNIDFYKELMLTSWADRKHRSLEKEVLAKADRVITIGFTMTEEMRALGAQNPETITNGFDEEDFTSEQVEVDSEFTLAHIGTFTPSRNHPNLWKSLAQLCAEHPEFKRDLKFRTVGVVDHSVKTAIEENGLAASWESIDYVPHSEVLRFQRCSRVLLVSINNTPNATGILPGKFFEYLASGRPILAIGPKKSDIGHVLNETKAGVIIEPSDLEGLKAAIWELYSGTAQQRSDTAAIQRFSRRGLTRKLAATLESL